MSLRLKSEMERRYSLITFFLMVFLVGCADDDVGELTVSENYDVPLRCTIPGKLDLDRETENQLKKYLQAGDKP